MAVDVDKTISITFAIGSALAAVGGILWALRFPQLFPFMGMMPGLKAFIAAVVGGIGNISGVYF
jgi:branched-chain amino acid transport system permease protein